MEAYTTVCGYGTGEIVEKKSRFIAEVFPVVSEDEISAHIEKIKKEYWDARHHCWAYVIGQNPGTERMSDDGEPAGTAGGKADPGGDPGPGAHRCPGRGHPVFWRDAPRDREDL